MPRRTMLASIQRENLGMRNGQAKSWQSKLRAAGQPVAVATGVAMDNAQAFIVGIDEDNGINSR